MKKSELIKRIEALEAKQKEIKESIQFIKDDAKKIKDDLFSKGTGFFRWAGYFKSDISTYKKIEKILEYLGIEIYEKASEIKVRSTYKPKKKKEKK